jgi:hypothetical protein
MTGRDEYGELLALIIFERYWSMIRGFIVGLTESQL